uniref:DUF115 domain-containing protein n=1 Tax=uncultured Rhizobiales bacterium HF4000_32B18 TaxID=710780 RepID=E0XWD4_9HYPH|nr:hypothetical protein [uncultured Rhizobiales bacterium HF4000_32B18]
MFEVAQIVRVDPGPGSRGGGESAVVIAGRVLVDAARPGLAMHSAARSLEALMPWAGEHMDPEESARHWLVLSALDRPAPAAMLEGLAEEPAGLRLLVDGPGEAADTGDLAAAMRAGAVPLPHVAIRLYDLVGLAAAEDPASAPMGCRIAADWIASGRAVRLVAADGAGLCGTAALEGAVLALRPVVGHVPLPLLQRLGALAGPSTGLSTGGGGLKALRGRHARLNGDVLARIAADPETARAFRAAGCGLTRPVRKVDGPGPWGEETFATELGRYGVERAWLGAQITRSRRTFETLKALRTRETCLIVGNGGSLAEADPALFEEHDVICSNFAFNSPLLARHAKILTVTNALVAEQGAAGFNASPIPIKVAPMWLAHVLHEEAGFAFVNATGENAFFGQDPAEKISWASTVSFFNLQLAYGLGYRRALLVGFDHSYVQPDESRLGDVLEQTEDDPNHFDALYFKKRRWQAADTAAMEAVYRLAREAYAADERDVLNLSPTSKLDVFDRHPPEAPLPPLLSHSVVDAAPSIAFDLLADEDEAALEAREAMAAAGFSCGEAKISDTLDSGNYKHVVCALTDVTAKRRNWAYIYLKLQSFNGEIYLEFRQGDFVPSGFTPWPIPDADTWGSFLRVPLDGAERAARSLENFAGGLGVEDRDAFTRLVGALPTLLRSAFAKSGADGAAWESGLAALEASRKVEATAST